MIQGRTSVFPKAFTELTFGLSNVLKVATFTFYQVYDIFEVARYGVFLASLVVKKSVVCLALSKKRTGKAAWVVAFFNSCGSVEWISRSRRLALRL